MMNIDRFLCVKFRTSLTWGSSTGKQDGFECQPARKTMLLHINDLFKSSREPITVLVGPIRPSILIALPSFGLINISSGLTGHRAIRVQAATNFFNDFDFDEWSRLAKDDPSGFERRRLLLIEDYLRQFPQSDQRRLRGIQFQIDMVRRRARTPMGACLKISSMMWESLLGRQGLKAALDMLLDFPNQSVSALQRQGLSGSSARILSFRKPAR